jgi:hypothetical protein
MARAAACHACPVAVCGGGAAQLRRAPRASNASTNCCAWSRAATHTPGRPDEPTPDQGPPDMAFAVACGVAIEVDLMPRVIRWLPSRALHVLLELILGSRR